MTEQPETPKKRTGNDTVREMYDRVGGVTTSIARRTGSAASQAFDRMLRGQPPEDDPPATASEGGVRFDADGHGIEE